MPTYFKYFICSLFILASLFSQTGCNHITHKTLSKGAVLDSTSEDTEPDYDVSLDNDYQDFTSYLYMGNRIENFSAYFNKHFIADKDFTEALEEYRASLISEYSRRLDSLGVTPPVSGSVKDKLDKAIERASKIIQFHKNSKYIDNAVLLIGISYYYLGDYLNSERKFNEFLSKLSSSENADEAILYLGRTKVKLGKRDEGEKILTELLNNTKDNEIKSLAVRDLGIIAFNKGNAQEAANDFKLSIDFSDESVRKAEGQFILAKILSQYKPELAAEEYKKVLDYSSDFDLKFYATLNYSKGLIYNKDFADADETLADLRKKYRDFPAYAQLVDLEIANSLYGQNKINIAKEKYFEIIVKYPSTPVSSDAYYFLGLNEENSNHDYLKALINYKKAVAENSSSEFYTESSLKAKTIERYFILLGDAVDTTAVIIPTANAEVESYRVQYNEEKGIEQIQNNENGNNENGNIPPPPTEQGRETGNGKGKPGGFSSLNFENMRDSIDEKESPLEQIAEESGNDSKEVLNQKKNENSTRNNAPENLSKDSSTISQQNDSSKAASDSVKVQTKKDKAFKAYYEIAEIFIYTLNDKDSAEVYLKLLLKKFDEPEYKAKVLYTLANFYKNNKRDDEADELFRKVISDYPNTEYAFESKTILGLNANRSDIDQNPADAIFTEAFKLYNEKKYTEAITKLYEIIDKYPDDSVLAKSFYGIGFIYENELVNKDSSMYYYKKLTEKFPESEYAKKISPKLVYIASLEVKDSVSVSDTTEVIQNDTLQNNPQTIQPDTTEANKPESVEEVKPDTSSTNTGSTLSQEEIDRLLKETETGTENPDSK